MKPRCDAPTGCSVRAPVGALAAALLLADYAWSLAPMIRWACVFTLVFYMAVYVSGWRGDDDLAALGGVGARWSTAAVVLWLAAGPMFTFALHPARASGASVAELAGHASPLCNDAYLLALVAAGAYFAGFTLAWWRGRN